jgi:uncharacterized protein
MMNRLTGFLAALAIALSSSAQAQRPPPAGSAQPAQAALITNWEELMPKGWDPMADLRRLNPLSVREGSAAEQALMKELRELWDNAPTRPELNGVPARIPGYIVPLDAAGSGRISQFLLVPYFGACIHSPPPPSNQVIHVTLKSPAEWRSMQAVWVSGRLLLQRQDSAMGVSSYGIRADRVEMYR